MCARWIKSLIQCQETGLVILSCLFGSQSLQSVCCQCNQRGPAVDSYLKSITSSVLCFFILHSLPVCIGRLFMFTWIHIFINIHSECHTCEWFERIYILLFQCQPARSYWLSLLLSRYLSNDVFLAFADLRRLLQHKNFQPVPFNSGETGLYGTPWEI